MPRVREQVHRHPARGVPAARRLRRLAQPYRTMEPAYQATIAREFGRFVGRGLVHKGLKPVHWCMHCKTALAQAEVEYEDQTTPSVYVKFPLVKAPSPALADARRPPGLARDLDDHAVDAAREPRHRRPPRGDLHRGGDGRSGPDRGPAARGGLPPAARRQGPRHRAAAHGPGPRARRPRGPPPVDRPGRAGRGRRLRGHGRGHRARAHRARSRRGGLRGRSRRRAQDLQPGRRRRALHRRGRALRRDDGLGGEPADHRAPALDRGAGRGGVTHRTPIRTAGAARTRRSSAPPSSGSSRSIAAVYARRRSTRSGTRCAGSPAGARSASATWSRTGRSGSSRASASGACRSWPSTARPATRSCSTRGWSSTWPGIMRAGAGADEWYMREAADLLPPGTRCPRCGGDRFRKETDILDVWFDSGCSHAAVLEVRPELRWPADMYLEGSDQHRGWFHSSLLEAVGTRDQPPYRSVLTHGFLVDGEGRKMSKSGRQQHHPGRADPEVRGRRCCACGWPPRTPRRTSGSRSRS